MVLLFAKTVALSKRKVVIEMVRHGVRRSREVGIKKLKIRREVVIERVSNVSVRKRNR